MISSNGSTNIDVADSAAIPNFSTSTSYALSYQIDGVTGALSDLLLNGSPVSLTFNQGQTNTVFANPIQYVGFYGSSSSYGGTGYVSDFELQVASGGSVPEPSTFALLFAGGISLFAIASRRRLT